MPHHDNKVVALFDNRRQTPRNNDISELHHALDMLETQINNIEVFGEKGKHRAIILARKNLLSAKKVATKIESKNITG
jgi:hypothetical protein